MKMKFFTPSLTLLLILATGVGCGSPQYRAHRPWNPASSGQNFNPDNGSNYVFTSIEFDDHGELLDRAQFTGTINEIRKIREQGHPMALLVFVHGWKHNASKHSQNWHSFRDYVREVAATQIAKNPDPNFKTVGVYIGWRGDVYNWGDPVFNGITWLPQQLSFYNRKKVAESVAGVSMTEVILSLAAQAKIQVHEQSAEKPDESKVIIIGHSFGGLIVERAVCQAMLGGMLLNVPSFEEIRQSKTNFQAEAARHDMNRKKAEQRMKDLEWHRQHENVDDYIAVKTKSLAEKIAEQENREKTALRDKDTAAKEVNQAQTTGETARRAILAELKLLRERSLPALRTALAEDAKKFPWLSQNSGALTEETIDLKAFGANAREFHASLHAGLVEEALRAISVTNAMTRELWIKGKESLQSLEDNLKPLSEAITVLSEAELKKATAEGQSKEIAKTARILESTLAVARITAEKEWLEARRHYRMAEEDSKSFAALKKEAEDKARYKIAELDNSPIDLILLVNPASESLVARMMIDALRQDLVKEYSNKSNVRPLLISVSSDADWATSKFFPLGRFLGSWPRNFRYYETNSPAGPFWRTRRTNGTQIGYYTRTAPHNPHLRTHIVVRRNDMTKENLTLSEIIRSNLTGEGLIDDNHIMTPSGWYELETANGANGSSAYWILKADAELIEGHGDIFTDDVAGLISALIRRSRALEPQSEVNGSIASK